MLHKFTIVAAWTLVVVLAYGTLTNVQFVYAIYYKLAPFLTGPVMTNYAHFEHVLGFAVFGAMFALAYPKRVFFVCCIVFIGAIILEYLQTFTPDRHGTLIDASEKIVGGALGIFAGRGMLLLRRTRKNC
jgi:VanZ family protein